MALASVWNNGSGSSSLPKEPKRTFPAIFGTPATGGSLAPVGRASSAQAGPPDRIDVNSIFGSVAGAGVQALGIAGQAPGFAYERPIAVLDTLTQKAGLGSPVAGVEKAVGSVPILGPLIGGLGDAVANVSNFVPAILNAPSLQHLADIPAGTPDSATLESVGLQASAGVNTVGDFRKLMRDRGFTAEDVAAVQGGTKSTFDYGNRALSDNPIADVAGRLALDPLNLMIGTGLITKAARGVGLLAKSVASGAELAKPLGLAQATEAVAAGIGRDATWAGAVNYMGQIGRSSLATYRTVAIGTTAAQLGIQGVAAVAPKGINTPLSGFLEGLNEVNKAAIDNRPLSNNMIFSVWSAFHFPVRDMVKTVTTKTGAAKYAAIGSEIRPKVVEALTEGKGLSNYAAKLAYVTEKLGPSGLDELIFQTQGSLAFNKVAPAIREGLSHSDSLAESVLANRSLETAIVEQMAADFRNNALRGRDIVAAIKDWHAFRRDPTDATQLANKVAFDWNGDQAMEQWVQYRSAAAPLSKVFQDRLIAMVGDTNDPMPLIGMSGVISKEDLSTMQVTMRAASKDGYVPASAINDLLSRAPQLMTLDKSGFWEKNLVSGAAAVKLDKVIGKLGSHKQTASTIRDITHESAVAEAGATNGLPTAAGPVGAQDWAALDNGVVLNASRWNAEAWGVKTTIGDAVAGRSDPYVQATEHNVAQTLNDSGWQVEQVQQTVGTYEGLREPGYDVILGPGSLQDHRLAAALTGQATDQQAVLLTIREAEARAMGLTPDGIEARWYLPGGDAAAFDKVATVMDEHFAGWTLNDGTGLVKVSMAPDWIKSLTGGTFQEHVDAINARLADIFPGDVVGDRGITHTVAPAYVESIGKESFNHVTYADVLAAAKSDPRVRAFAGNAPRLAPDAAAARTSAARGGSGSPVLPVDPIKSPAEVFGTGAVAQAVTEPGYLYHTTDTLAAQEIAAGALETHGPGYRGEQLQWPTSNIGDHPGSRRSYWSRDVAGIEAFQTEPNSAILRTREATAPGRVRTAKEGDVYLSRKVPAQKIEILGGDGQWHPLAGFYDTPGGNVPAYMQPVADLVAPAYDPANAAIQAAYDEGQILRGQALNREAGVTRGGTVESGGAMKPSSPLTQAIRADLDASQVAVGIGPGVTSEQIRGQVLWNAQRDAQVEAMLPITRFENGGIEHASDPFKNALSPIEQMLHEMGPQYTVKAGPKLAWLYEPGAHGQVMSALRDREGLALWLFHDSPFAPASRFIENMTAPVHSADLARTARQAAYAELVPLGAKPKEIDAWFHAMSQNAQENTIGSMRIPLFRGAGGITTNKMNDLAAGLPGQPGTGIFSRKVIDQVGRGRFHNVYDRAVNRFISSVEQKERLGTANRLETAADALYRRYQVTPVGDASRIASKTFYHLFRFITDPRWHAMNLLEADVLGGLRYGREATRFGKTGDLRTQPISAAAAAHGGVGGVAERADTGWLNSHNLSGYISRGFDAERPNSVITVLNGMDQAGFTAIRNFFPEGRSTTADLVTELDHFLYSYDTKGVGQTITDNLHHWGTAQDLKEPGAAAIIQRIWDANQQTYTDVTRVFEGNGSRSTVERLMNSYWLYWPLSYQLKAGKWLLDTLTHRAFGETTNMAGAAVYSQMVKLHEERVQTDPAYAGIFTNNPTAWMIAQMLLPITPGDLGVSLSRPVRYAASWAKAQTGGEQGPLGFFGTYAAAKDPFTAASKVLNLGLPYTMGLLTQLNSETTHLGSAPTQ